MGASDVESKWRWTLEGPFDGLALARERRWLLVWNRRGLVQLLDSIGTVLAERTLPVEPMAADISGSLDAELLRRCAAAMFDRHPNLRASFYRGDLRKPVQVIPADGSPSFQARIFAEPFDSGRGLYVVRVEPLPETGVPRVPLYVRANDLHPLPKGKRR